jgi:hypothetical protein
MALTAITVAVGLMASPWLIAAAQTATTSTTTTSTPASSQNFNCQGMAFGRGHGDGSWGFDQYYANAPALSVGQTITLTSTQGAYYVMGSSTNGTASGTVTFTVTAKLTGGYTLSISSGTLTVAGTTYTISSGSAQAGLFATTIVGQGATSPTGQFLLRASAVGSFAGTTGHLFIDLQSGSTEYAVALAGTISS